MSAHLDAFCDRLRDGFNKAVEIALATATQDHCAAYVIVRMNTVNYQVMMSVLKEVPPEVEPQHIGAVISYVAGEIDFDIRTEWMDQLYMDLKQAAANLETEGTRH